MTSNVREFPHIVLDRILNAALAAARPEATLAEYLPPKPTGRCIVIGAGKASPAMAAALEKAWPDVALSGLVSTRYGHSVKTRCIDVIEAGHPVPDQNSVDATKRMMTIISGLTSDDLVLALISGGGSACLALPIPGVSLDEKQQLTKALLSAGAPISDINFIRGHLSQVKAGGLLRAAAPAQVMTLAISDVPGDLPEMIASGPTVPGRRDPEEALALLGDAYGITVSDRLREAVLTYRSDQADAPKSTYQLIATPKKSLAAAAEVAQEMGYTPLILGDAIEGESKDVGTVMAGIAKSVLSAGHPVAPPCVLLSGGETTVTMRGDRKGRGGPNHEFCLSFATALDGNPSVWAMAADTDGFDGAADSAGAIVTPDTLRRARTSGLSASTALANHDSFTFFESLGDVIRTGATHTNVNDIRAILINPSD